MTDTSDDRMFTDSFAPKGGGSTEGDGTGGGGTEGVDPDLGADPTEGSPDEPGKNGEPGNNDEPETEFDRVEELLPQAERTESTAPLP